MLILETFYTSLNALITNKTRSFLTMLGVVIGVAAVVMLISIGKGVQNYITDQFEALGSNLIFVVPGNRTFGDDPASSFSRNKLDKKHVDLVERYASESIQFVTPYIASNANIKYKTKTFSAAINGGNENGINIYNFEIAQGRFFTRNEVNTKSKVLLLGTLVAEELFNNRPAIGQKVKVNKDNYEVIGILEPKGQSYDDAIIVPYTSIAETFDIKNFTGIAIKSKNGIDTDTAMRQIELAVRRDLNEDEFNVLSQQDILSSIQDILQILTIGLGAIAAISLIVGGIGIMNIMLVSVTERTREIGLRKAVGATPANIATQFLIESVLLSVSGGIIGLLIGWGGSLAARGYLRTEVPWWSVLLAFSFAAGVGIIFGTYPAVKASRKDPIEALRFE